MNTVALQESFLSQLSDLTVSNIKYVSQTTISVKSGKFFFLLNTLYISAKETTIGNLSFSMSLQILGHKLKEQEHQLINFQ